MNSIPICIASSIFKNYCLVNQNTWWKKRKKSEPAFPGLDVCSINRVLKALSFLPHHVFHTITRATGGPTSRGPGAHGYLPMLQPTLA